ncbi:MAG TPA: error-prone DNA polymerase [Acidimicrobiales bacterium]|nr:error-prone DNA polymerase [Acidimicrobiales bacterium]
MGFGNPQIPWRELEQRYSGKVRHQQGRRRDGRSDAVPAGADGGDSPAWSRKRSPYVAPDRRPRSDRAAGVPYAELHCHSNFSFLDGASHPEELAEEADRLGLEALALTDHDGFYGVVRFAEAAREVGLPTVFGAELTLDGAARTPAGVADPPGRHVVVLARDPVGYARLARAISEAQMAGEKGAPRLTLDELALLGSGGSLGTTPASRPGGTGAGPAGAADHWLVLTGCRKGAVPAALVDAGPSAAARELQRLLAAFGPANVAVELWDHGDPLDSARNDALAELAVRAGLPLVATNNVHYAVPTRRRLATALAAVRARRSLEEVDPWLPAGAGAHLRSGAEQARRFARWPGVVERAAALGRECAFDLRLVAPKLPPFPCPDGLDEMAFLRRLAVEGATRRYGPRHASATDPLVARAWTQIDHELEVIEQLGFPGYFLVVWDIVQFCERAGIFCQGRGSAANSAVCFALGVTRADAVRLGLLFERFLSPERDGPPDIDLDIESGRREEAIQYVYARYGRQNAAQVANVITYRPRSAIRDMAKALGYATGQQDAFAKQIDHWGPLPDAGGEVPAAVVDLAGELLDAPRHLGIHSGGMVICDRPVVEVCPVEWGRMEGRSVLQWDKDDCAAEGLVKFDLLGLGMLTALHEAVDLIRAHRDYELDLAELPQDPAVYDMLCRADSVGVFQVESRAQMATLPRLRPREFYDLVVEVALIRPGPIQGGSVHPYIRRRNGREPVTYLHPLLEPALRKTLGIPLFQEQLMQMAIDVGGFSAADADQLRQAMGAKRSAQRMERLRARFYGGMAERGITGDIADAIWDKLAAFANFGFPESHSVSFAYLVYSSAWIKLYEPAAFCAALLNAQPMGFYSPHSLVQDARRHGVVVHSPDLAASSAKATLEPCPGSHNDVAVRMGISSVRTIGAELAERIAAGRPYTGMEDVARRCGLSQPQLEALATAGAFACFAGAGPSDGAGSGGGGMARRAALWAAGAVAQGGPGRLPGVVTGVEAPPLPGLSPAETAVADLWATGVAPDGHPTRFVRDTLDRLGVTTAVGLHQLPDRAKVTVGGVVTHRQRPATAGGTVFVNLEDETGLINVVCSKGCWARYRRLARTCPALLVRGRLEKVEGVVNVVAEKLEPLPLAAGTLRSRDFR